MGYSHSWERIEKFPVDKWEAFVKDVRKIFRAAKIQGLALICNLDGGPPRATSRYVSFNDKHDGHSDFHFERKTDRWSWNQGDLIHEWCNTHCARYDTVVCAVLIAAKHHFGDSCKISSDGAQPDWTRGMDLAARARVPGASSFEIVEGYNPFKPKVIHDSDIGRSINAVRGYLGRNTGTNPSLPDVNAARAILSNLAHAVVLRQQATCKLCDGTGKEKGYPPSSSCSSCGKENTE